jgi:hypothetical protein
VEIVFSSVGIAVVVGAEDTGIQYFSTVPVLYYLPPVLFLKI